MPAFGALIAEPLFLFADAVIISRLGTIPLGALGVASQALTTLVGIPIFLAYGTTAAMARQIGAGRREAAIRRGIDGLWLAAIIGAVVLAVAVAASGANVILNAFLVLGLHWGIAGSAWGTVRAQTGGPPHIWPWWAGCPARRRLLGRTGGGRAAACRAAGGSRCLPCCGWRPRSSRWRTWCSYSMAC